MAAERISFERRDELIARFNERVKDGSAFLEIEEKQWMKGDVEDLFDVLISDIAVGHGALVIASIDGGQDEAIPFAIDPDLTKSPGQNNYIYGLHRYVAYEAIEELQREWVLDSALDMWHIDTRQIIAVLRGKGGELSKREIEQVRRLSPATSDIVYATIRFEDEARIRIVGGAVLARACWPGHDWV